jgi:hypothetical protein
MSYLHYGCQRMTHLRYGYQRMTHLRYGCQRTHLRYCYQRMTHYMKRKFITNVSLIILETELSVWQAVLSKIYIFYVSYSRGV